MTCAQPRSWWPRKSRTQFCIENVSAPVRHPEYLKRCSRITTSSVTTCTKRADLSASGCVSSAGRGTLHRVTRITSRGWSYDATRSRIWLPEPRPGRRRVRPRSMVAGRGADLGATAIGGAAAAGAEGGASGTDLGRPQGLAMAARSLCRRKSDSQARSGAPRTRTAAAASAVSTHGKYLASPSSRSALDSGRIHVGPLHVADEAAGDLFRDPDSTKIA